MVFLTNESPIFSALEQKILDEINKSNGIKAHSFFLTKEIYDGKCLQKLFIPHT